MRNQIASQMSMEFARHLATPARRARRVDMSRAGFIGLCGGMEWWPRSSSPYFGFGPIPRLGHGHDRLLLQRVQ